MSIHNDISSLRVYGQQVLDLKGEFFSRKIATIYVHAFYLLAYITMNARPRLSNVKIKLYAHN